MFPKLVNKAKKSALAPILLLCSLALVVWLVNLYFHPDYASSPDASLYAGTARNIIKGNGFYSPGITPSFLGYPIPSLPCGWPAYFGLLHPLAIVIFFLLFGINNFSLILSNGFFFILTLPLLFLLAKKVYNLKTAFLASLWYIFTPSLLDYSISGMSEPLFIFLLILTLFLLFVRKGDLFWAGVTTGLAYLTRFQGLFLLPPLTLFIYKTKKDRPFSWLFLAGFATVILLNKLLLPPIASDYANISNHQLWSTIAYNSIIPRYQMARNLTPTTLSLILANLNLVWAKIAVNLYYFSQKFFMITLPSVTLLYILSFLKLNPNLQAKYFKSLSLSLILIFLAFHLVTFSYDRYLHPLLPLIIILAAGTFLSFLEKFNPQKIFKMAVIFTFLFIIIPCFTSPGWGTSIQRTLARPRKPTIISILGKIVKENTPQDAIIISNDFAHLAWYGERRAINLPLSPDELKKLDKVIFIDAVFLSSHEFKTQLEPEWQELVDNPHDFGDFYLAEKFEIRPEENYYRIPAKVVLYLKRE